jgi:hypothetical protein
LSRRQPPPLLHTPHIGDIGDITAASRHDAAAPTSAACAGIADDQARTVRTIQVLDSPQSRRIYVRDAVHPAHSGSFPWGQPRKIADLDQFVLKCPMP